MSKPWYSIFGPKDWTGVEIKTGNKKVDGKYFNILGSRNVQLAASGIMWLVGGSGIRLISAGPVDVSGLRAISLQAQNIKKIDASGSGIPTYVGLTGSLLYKQNDDAASAIPGGLLVYDTGLNKLTMPNKSYGVLYLDKGPEEEDNHKAIDTWTNMSFVPQKVIDNGPNDPPTIIPPETHMRGLVKFADNIIISPEFESFKGSILTHMGSGVPAEWRAAPYLKASGVMWSRYPKRPALMDLENSRLIFYKGSAPWVKDFEGAPTVQTLITELGTGSDTLEIETADDRNIAYAKIAAEIRYIPDDTNPDIQAPLEVLFEDNVSFRDPDDPLKEKAPLQQGIAVRMCPKNPYGNREDRVTNPKINVYVHSVTKGGYLDMRLSPDAKTRFSCSQSLDAITDPSSPFTFKPSTYNTISIRPDIHTSFNKLGENIDFVIYGEQKTQYDRYEASLFDLDNSLLPKGMTPAFKIDANVPDAVSGNPSSGVLFVKYLDRNRVVPSGFDIDPKAKITINTKQPYVVDSIPSGTGVAGTGFISYYADLTVDSTLYSQNIIADKLYLRPKPLENNEGEYIANSLLTIDRSGRIISRIPRTNPTVPSRPLGIQLDPGHQRGIGNGEASIVWAAPSGDGRSSIVEYKLEFSTNNGETWTSIPNNLYTVDQPSPTIRAATILGLSPITPYKFRVAAQNGVGIGAFSEPSNEITVASDVPKAPVNLAASRAFDETPFSNIQLSWEPPHAGTAQDLLGYTIEESSDNGSTWYWYNPPSALINEIGELISGTESKLDYTYRVSAWNIHGQSAYAYVRSASNLIVEVDPEEIQKEEEKKTDVLSNWDFGSVLFTGVCPI